MKVRKKLDTIGSPPMSMSWCQKALASFHYKADNKCMKVVENNKAISGMVRDEVKRCV